MPLATICPAPGGVGKGQLGRGKLYYHSESEAQQSTPRHAARHFFLAACCCHLLLDVACCGLWPVAHARRPAACAAVQLCSCGCRWDCCALCVGADTPIAAM